MLGLAILVFVSAPAESQEIDVQPSQTAQTSSSPAANVSCAALRDLYLQSTSILLAAEAAPEGGLPAFCRVVGVVRPQIHFELRMPLQGWNSKLYMVGCGGFCGNLDADLPGFVNAMNYGLARGYAAVTTDGGHWGDSRASGLWGFGNRQAEIDWGSRAVGSVADVAKRIVEAYYAASPLHAYFAGCGTGGRMGAMAATRQPDAFDGIIAGDPFLEQTDVMGVLYAWQAQAATTAEGRPVLEPEEIDVLTQAVRKTCDKADGAEDGLIAEPQSCAFDPGSLRCTNGEADCLTPDQVEAANRLYAGATDSEGNRLTYGLPLGSEPFWPFWVTGSVDSIGVNLLFNREFLRYLAYDPDPGETYDTLIFDFDQDPPALELARRTYDVGEPDLDAFEQAGGKLILYHGLADAAVPVQYSIDFYERTAVQRGGDGPAQEFVRLFLVPGMDHCAAQPGLGPDQFDALSPLERWVENGEAPASITAEQKAADGTVQRTRSLCPYPQTAVLKSGADPNLAESFDCAER